jgi:cytochrome bd-type quinol oxidase subunit 2
MKTLLAQSTEIGGKITSIGGYDPSVVEGGKGLATTQFANFASNLISLITTVGGLMFLLYFILGGLSWITAGGDKGKVDEAKSKMTNAAIGLIVIASSYAIAFIIGKVLGIDILNPSVIIKEITPGSQQKLKGLP